MTFREDDRGAAIQIGAIILFGFLILAITSWQVAVVPQENARVEFTHNQRAQDDMQDVRNAIVSAPGTAAIASVGVDMGPEYPPRTIFVNPAPPTGTLRTVGTTNASLNLTVGNATAATDDEAADFWDGSPTRYDTGGLAYEPDYNEFDGAPDTVYENSVLYNEEGEGVVVNVSGQSLVDGRTVTLVTLNGSLSRTTSATYSLDFEALSTDSTTVAVTNTGGNVTISFASLRGPGWWNASLAESGELDEQGGNVVDVRAGSPPTIGEFHNVTIELEPGITYDLRMAKVGVGSGTVDPGKHYVTNVVGDGASVRTGNTRQLVVEVRDRFNNPISGVTVRNDSSGSVTSGSLDAESKTTGSDGRVTFEYTGSSAGTDTVVFNISDDAGPTARELASFEVAVTSSSTGSGSSGSGTYSIEWQDPDADNPSGPLSGPCTETDCTWDVGADPDGELDLRAVTDPTVEDLDVTFNVNNSSVGSLLSSTDNTATSGEVTTTLNAAANGTVNVFVTGGSASDVINLSVTNVSGGGGTSPEISQFDVTDNSDTTSPNKAKYEVNWSVTDSQGNLDQVIVTIEDNTGSEVYNETSTTTSGVDTWESGGQGANEDYTITVEGQYTDGTVVCKTVTDTADNNDPAESSISDCS